MNKSMMQDCLSTDFYVCDTEAHHLVFSDIPICSKQLHINNTIYFLKYIRAFNLNPEDTQTYS